MLNPINSSGSRLLDRLFAIDFRSLALVRICLGFLVSLDATSKLYSFKIFHSAEGLVPLSSYESLFPEALRFSLYFLNDSAFFSGILLSLTILIGLLLAFGFRTKLCTALAWILVISLHARNPNLLDAGDHILRLLLFLLIFLPAGAVYSLDSALDQENNYSGKSFFSLAGIAFMLQAAMVYIFVVFRRAEAMDVWLNQGWGVYLALHLDAFLTPLGIWLKETFPFFVMKQLSRLTIALEFIAPLLLFVPFRTSKARIIAIVLLSTMHLGFFLAMYLGLFPFISITSLLIFLPREFWNRAAIRFGPRAKTPLKIFYDRDCGFCKKGVLLLRTFLMLENSSIAEIQDDSEANMLMEKHNTWVVRNSVGKSFIQFDGILEVLKHAPLFWPLAAVFSLKPFRTLGTVIYKTIASNRQQAALLTHPFKYSSQQVRPQVFLGTVALFFTGLHFYWNFSAIGTPVHLNAHVSKPLLYRNLMTFLYLDKEWRMFSPFPPADDGWPVIVGTFEDGTKKDLITGLGTRLFERPESFYQRYSNQQWLAWLFRLRHPNQEKFLQADLEYRCRVYSARGKSARLASVEFYFMEEKTVMVGLQPEIERRLLAERSCS